MAEMKCQCGSTSFEVIRTEHDLENNPIRLRQCRSCKTRIATQEKQIPLERFYAVIYKPEFRQARHQYRATSRTCLLCVQHYGRHREYTYAGGQYSQHCRSKRHQALLARGPVTNKTRKSDALRGKRRYWRNRGFTFMEPGNEALHKKRIQEIASEERKAQEQLEKAS